MKKEKKTEEGLDLDGKPSVGRRRGGVTGNKQGGLEEIGRKKKKKRCKENKQRRNVERGRKGYEDKEEKGREIWKRGWIGKNNGRSQQNRNK